MAHGLNSGRDASKIDPCEMPCCERHNRRRQCFADEVLRQGQVASRVYLGCRQHIRLQSKSRELFGHIVAAVFYKAVVPANEACDRPPFRPYSGDPDSMDLPKRRLRLEKPGRLIASAPLFPFNPG
jgi:hypothetical protein